MKNFGIDMSGAVPLKKPPLWLSYGVTILVQAMLIALFEMKHPGLTPLSFLLPQIIVVVGIAYLFGEGPALISFLLGGVCFAYFLIFPKGWLSTGVSVPSEWDAMVDYLLGGLLIGAFTLLMRYSRNRILRLADELKRQKALLDAFMESVPVGLGFHDKYTRHVLANRTLLDMNRQLAKANGATIDSIVGKTVWEVLPKELAKGAAETIDEVFASGEASHWPDMTIEADGEHHYNVNHLPVRTPDGKMIGVGVVVTDITDQAMARKELQRMYEHEHHIAEILQTSLLPVVPPRIECFSFEALYQAAMEEALIGGDFYDVFRISEDKIGIVVGDVSGKGLQAAVQVAMSKDSIRVRAYDSDSPAVVMEQVNRTLIREGSAENFVTIFFGVLNCAEKTFVYSNAGHAPAMLWKSAESEGVQLLPTGPLVGTIADAVYEERTIKLNPDDELLLATDGLYEIHCCGELLGTEGLLDIYTLMKRSGGGSASELVDEVRRLCIGDLQDDIAILRVTADGNRE